MQTFLITLLICSVTMSVLALLYMASAPFLARRYSEKGRYYAWLIIVVGLLIPFRPQWGNALFSVEVPSSAPPPVVQMYSEAPGYIAPPTILPSVDNVTVFGTTFHNMALGISWWQIGFMVWAAGLIVFIAYHGIKHYRFAKMARRWSETITDGQILSLLQSIKSEMGIVRQTPIYLCTFVGSPMMVGLFKPRILLPTVELAQGELCFILKHELVHYKRKDLLYKYLVMAASALHWFNPVVYMMARAVNLLCETSCDAEVLQNADKDTRQSYGETIIGVVQYHSKLKTALSTNFYGGKNSMRTRISSIMDSRKKRMGAIIVSLILTATFGTGFVFAMSNPSPAITDYQAFTGYVDSITFDSGNNQAGYLRVRGEVYESGITPYIRVRFEEGLTRLRVSPSDLEIGDRVIVFHTEKGLTVSIARDLSGNLSEHPQAVQGQANRATDVDIVNEAGEWDEWLDWFDSLSYEQQSLISVRPPVRNPSGN